MRSSVLGKNTSRAEVQDISRHGIWLYARGQEFLLPFKEYPWFKTAKVSAVYNVKLLHRSHLYWPDLDVDLDIESLEQPEKYPLLATGMPNIG
ncbi:MAG: DUF2442 domain-containing protein [Elusimicrobia bacterium]|nr:DUF2442 domain-containing protein [Elusimicrobiota bacterium]